VNRLAAEASPYLRQHAANPVDWYPWGPDAFAAAKLRDVPILLSIGYSACHWCHVMAHESFEDPATAAVINGGFVPVKVDREERPDVDAVYMEAVQALTGGGGWPMTVFLLADGRPFLGGTYYPRERFVELMHQVVRAWRERRSEIEQAATQLAAAVRTGTSLPRLTTGHASKAPLLEHAADSVMARFDHEWGGFGSAPKFPQPSTLEMLMLAASGLGRDEHLSALNSTLDAMAAGGIYDHLGGGFHRYSTDRRWLVPHFEKMFYDNALLARAYLHAWQLTGLERHAQVVRETISYLLRPPMRLAEGGFASAEDADSEGEEGRFYVWDLAEALEVAGPEAARWYGMTPTGNWEGRNIVYRPERGSLARPPEVEEGRRRLFERRESRPRPGLDDKVLTEWNAMAVAALAEAGGALNEPAWVTEAERAANFLLASLRRESDGRWLRSWQAGAGARHLAYASDHAWLTEAFVRLYEATGRAVWVERASEAADSLVELFFDPHERAFATTGRDAEALIARPIDTQDGALPSTNSVACAALLRLATLTGESTYRDHALAVATAMEPAIESLPAAFAGMVAAACLCRVGLSEIVVTGERPDLLAAVRRRYLPTAVLASGEPFDSPLWEGRSGPGERGLAFVCRNHVCERPVSDPEDLAGLLDDLPAA
jgi:uncharacterized protein YyaL (SSP411 family)